MAVTTSASFDFIAALLAKFHADTTLIATYNVLVIDGPPLTDLSRPNILFVGAQPSGEGSGASFAQRWGEMGTRSKYELISADCEFWVRDGSTDLSTLRATAKALLAAVESALRTDFTLSVAALQWCSVASGDVIQQQTTTGASIAVPFTITAQARLASQ